MRPAARLVVSAARGGQPGRGRGVEVLAEVRRIVGGLRGDQLRVQIVQRRPEIFVTGDQPVAAAA